MSFLKPKAPPKPPSTPTRADASLLEAGQRAMNPMQSLVGTGSATGLTRKPNTQKSSLVGGS